MIHVLVFFKPNTGRAVEVIRLSNYTELTPQAAVAARDVAAGVVANVTVTDGNTTYCVVGNRARKV